MKFRLKDVNGELRKVENTEPDAPCELCGKVEEPRPYGPNGENICFECGERDPKTTERMMRETNFANKAPKRRIN